jgi:hypothetical protein
MMGKLDIVLNTLGSRITRKSIGQDGIRRLEEGKDTSTWNNFLASSFTGLGKVLGWALEKIIAPFLATTATTIWSWIVGGTTYLLNFDFNATDEDMEKRLEQLELALYGQLGELVGTTLGWAICGYLPGLTLLKFNEALAWHILKEVNEEALDEILGELGSFAVFVRNWQSQKFFTRMYCAVRALIKNAANESSDTLAGGFIELFFNKFPNLKKAAKTWGNKGSQPWTISRAIEDAVEKIPNEKFREFLENALESLGDSCVEAGYIVAGSIDAWHYQQKLNKNQVLGEEKTVEIILNRDIKDEPYKETVIISGREHLVRPTIVQTMATYQLLNNKDIGVFIGETIPRYAKKIPSEFEVKIYWSDRKDGSKRGKIWTYTTLSNFDKTKLDDYDKIKRIAGGDNGRPYGNVTVKALCNDGSKITVKVQTESQGVDLIKELITLTNNTIQWETQNQKIRKEGELAIKYDDEWIDPSTVVYPAKIVILNKYRITNQLNTGNKGRIDYKGEYLSKQVELPLWMDNKPLQWDATIQEIKIIPGTNPV